MVLFLQLNESRSEALFSLPELKRLRKTAGKKYGGIYIQHNIIPLPLHPDRKELPDAEKRYILWYMQQSIKHNMYVQYLSYLQNVILGIYD